jgi:hypothetical protein
MPAAKKVAENCGTDTDIEGMSPRDLTVYMEALTADVISGTVTHDNAKTIAKRIGRRLKATEQKLRGNRT